MCEIHPCTINKTVKLLAIKACGDFLTDREDILRYWLPLYTLAVQNNKSLSYQLYKRIENLVFSNRWVVKNYEDFFSIIIFLIFWIGELNIYEKHGQFDL